MKTSAKTTVVAVLALSLACLLAASAAASPVCPPLQFESSKKQIDMGMTYAGDTIAISGIAPAGSQVAVLAASKNTPPMALSRKGRVVVFWMSVKQLEACNMPALYRLYTSGPMTQVCSVQAADQLRLGYPSLRRAMTAKCTKGEPSDDDADLLFKGFIRLKEKDGLYGVNEGSVKVSPDGRFEETVAFPDKVPEGPYMIRVYAFKDGQLVGSGETEITAQKVGLDKWLATTAKESGLTYGLMAVVVALSAGLGVGMIFKKGGSH